MTVCCGEWRAVGAADRGVYEGAVGGRGRIAWMTVRRGRGRGCTCWAHVTWRSSRSRRRPPAHTVHTHGRTPPHAGSGHGRGAARAPFLLSSAFITLCGFSRDAWPPQGGGLVQHLKTKTGSLPGPAGQTSSQAFDDSTVRPIPAAQRAPQAILCAPAQSARPCLTLSQPSTLRSGVLRPATSRGASGHPLAPGNNIKPTGSGPRLLHRVQGLAGPEPPKPVQVPVQVLRRYCTSFVLGFILQV
jgi:hypothetical protein